MRSGTTPDAQSRAAGQSQSDPAREVRTAICRCLAMGLLAWVTQVGCSRWTQQTLPVGPLLQSAVATNDAVTLEIFFARFPRGDTQLNGPAWDEIDEQAIPVAVRHRLAANGFRAGLAAGNLPPSMANLLQLHDRSPSSPTGLQVVDLQSEPTATQRLLQLSDGQPGYIAKSEVRSELPVLWYRNGQLEGRTFHGAQCLFAARTTRQEDGRVEVELVPELHYGEAQQQYRGENGVFRVQNTRPKQVFADLAIRAVLSPGQMLVIGGRDERSGSIGDRFFSAVSECGEEQKLLVLRLVHSAPDDPLQANDDPLQANAQLGASN